MSRNWADEHKAGWIYRAGHNPKWKSTICLKKDIYKIEIRTISDFNCCDFSQSFSSISCCQMEEKWASQNKSSSTQSEYTLSYSYFWILTCIRLFLASWTASSLHPSTWVAGSASKKMRSKYTRTGSWPSLLHGTLKETQSSNVTISQAERNFWLLLNGCMMNEKIFQ